MLVFLILMTLSKLLPQVYDFFQGIISFLRRLLSSAGSSARGLADGSGFLRMK